MFLRAEFMFGGRIYVFEGSDAFAALENVQGECVRANASGRMPRANASGRMLRANASGEAVAATRKPYIIVLHLT